MSSPFRRSRKTWIFLDLWISGSSERCLNRHFLDAWVSYHSPPQPQNFRNTRFECIKVISTLTVCHLYPIIVQHIHYVYIALNMHLRNSSIIRFFFSANIYWMTTVCQALGIQTQRLVPAVEELTALVRGQTDKQHILRYLLWKMYVYVASDHIGRSLRKGWVTDRNVLGKEN